MNIPTLYRVWPFEERPGWIAVGIWHQANFDGSRHPKEQLGSSLFHDEMPATMALKLGEGFVGVVANSFDYLLARERTRLAEQASAQAGPPMTAEELTRLSIWSAGLDGIDLNPQSGAQ